MNNFFVTTMKSENEEVPNCVLEMERILSMFGDVVTGDGK